MLMLKSGNRCFLGKRETWYSLGSRHAENELNGQYDYRV